MRLTTGFLASAIFVLSAAPLWAHDEFRIIGTITKPQQSALEVRTKEGKIVSVKLDKQTFISRDKKKADIAELKTGGNVVIDAYGDDYSDLLALEVRLVPTITAPAR